VKNNIYTLYYAAILGVVCSLLLTFAASFTEPYRLANAKAEELSNILAALKVPLEPDASSERLIEIFNANVHTETQGEQTLYIYSPPQAEGAIEAIAVKFSGPGLWGTIEGVLALESDRKTIRGINFYEQEETPGLGGEIVSSQFRDQFAGKLIVDKSGKGGIVIQSGFGNKLNGVDAITGATMTCDKVEDMLNNVINAILEEHKQNGQ
jgi:Na+-transporting NADH:ubiquinone oxidoreductase subunit C